MTEQLKPSYTHVKDYWGACISRCPACGEILEAQRLAEIEHDKAKLPREGEY